MSGNGAKYDYQGVNLSQFPAPYNLIPPDQGGGCVTDGPFKKYLLHLSLYLLCSSHADTTEKHDGQPRPPRHRIKHSKRAAESTSRRLRLQSS